MDQSNYTQGLFPLPPYQQHWARDSEPTIDELLRGPIFASPTSKHDKSQLVPRSSSASVRSRHAPSVSPYPEDRSTTKTQRILIEPSRVEHPAQIRNIIAGLPSTLGRIIESWSGETSDSQVTVVKRMIKELEPESKAILNQYMVGRVHLDPESIRQMLIPLCGLEGKLCSVDRKGTQSGVSSIACAKCTESFHSNPVQAFAHHLISSHWKIKVFACYAPKCPKQFSWSQDRDRHEKTKHNAYRRKAYEVAMKQESSTHTPEPLTEAQKLYQAFRGYDIVNNRWES